MSSSLWPYGLYRTLTSFGASHGVVLMGKNKTVCHCRRYKRPRFNPWVRKIPWRRAWRPTPEFLPGESHGQGSLVGCSPWGCKVSDMKEAMEHAGTHVTISAMKADIQMRDSVPASQKGNRSSNTMVELLNLCYLFFLTAACFACISSETGWDKRKREKRRKQEWDSQIRGNAGSWWN